MSELHVAGVVGWPLHATFSPAIHNAAFLELRLPWVYTTWPVAPDDLNRALDAVRVLRIAGLNVTIPHKETIAPLLDELDGEAAVTGAVNTVAVRDGRLVGYNTDVAGFSSFLSEDAGVGVEGRRVLVLGAGGAARAVVRALSALEPARIAVAARDDQRAAAVAALADPVRGTAHQWIEAPWLVRDCHLVVNTTPPEADAAALLRGGLGDGQHVVDINYMPDATALVADARSAGVPAWGGLGMLVRQAAAAFEIFTGRPAPVDVMSAAATAAAAAFARTND